MCKTSGNLRLENIFVNNSTDIFKKNVAKHNNQHHDLNIFEGLIFVQCTERVMYICRSSMIFKPTVFRISFVLV